MKKINFPVILIILSAFLLTLTACSDSAAKTGDLQPQGGSATDARLPGSGTGDDNPDSQNPGSSGSGPDGSDGSDGSTGNTDPGADPGAIVLPDFALMVDGFLIELNQDIALVLDTLGEPRAIFEEPSCAFEGIDRIFGYADMQIHTYPVGDTDQIHTIMFLNDLIRTTEGRIRIRHSTLQDVIDAYGDDYEYGTSIYTYTRGLTTLQFYVIDDIVEGITYGFTFA